LPRSKKEEGGIFTGTKKGKMKPSTDTDMERETHRRIEQRAEPKDGNDWDQIGRGESKVRSTRTRIAETSKFKKNQDWIEREKRLEREKGGREYEKGKVWRRSKRRVRRERCKYTRRKAQPWATNILPRMRAKEKGMG